MAKIALVISDRIRRALIGAELQERGHDITGFETLREVTVPVSMGLYAPEAIVVDTDQQDLNAAEMAKLKQIEQSTPVLIIAGQFDTIASDLPRYGFQHTIVKPAFIRNVVAEIEDLTTN